MSAYLTNKTNIIISTGSTPTSAEIAAQFSPQTLKPDIDSLASEDSGRSDDGYMHINWVLSRVRKLNITLAPDTIDNISVILDKVLGKHIYVTYWDIVDNQEETRYMYCSNGSGNWYSGVIYNGLLQDVAFNIIEVSGEE